MPWYPAPARFAAATYRYASSENRCQPIAGEHLAPASRPGTAGRRAYRGGPSDRSAARTVLLEIPSTRATCLTGSPSARCNCLISAQSSTEITSFLPGSVRARIPGRRVKIRMVAPGSVFTCRRQQPRPAKVWACATPSYRTRCVVRAWSASQKQFQGNRAQGAAPLEEGNCYVHQDRGPSRAFCVRNAYGRR